MAKKAGGREDFTAKFIPSDVEQVSFFDNIVLDNMMTVMIAMGSEVWSMRRRMMVLEKLLESKGVTGDMVEAFMPSEADAAAWKTERDAFVKRVFSALEREGGLTLTSPMQKS
jgi:hypothetical protein